MHPLGKLPQHIPVPVAADVAAKGQGTWPVVAIGDCLTWTGFVVAVSSDTVDNDEAGCAAPVGCDLRKDSVSAFTPPIDKPGALFPDALSCPPKRVPSTIEVEGFTATPDIDLSDSVSTGEPLIVYEVLCPCTGTLLCTKNGPQVHAHWIP